MVFKNRSTERDTAEQKRKPEKQAPLRMLRLHAFGGSSFKTTRAVQRARLPKVVLCVFVLLAEPVGIWGVDLEKLGVVFCILDFCRLGREREEEKTIKEKERQIQR